MSESALTPKETRTALVITAIIVALGLVALTIYVLIKPSDDTKSDKSSEPQTGYRTASDLEPAIAISTRQRLIEMNNLTTVNDVSCVEGGDREYLCNVQLSTGQNVSLDVQVSKDYQSWVSH